MSRGGACNASVGSRGARGETGEMGTTPLKYFFINKLNIKKKVYLCTLFEVKCFVMDKEGWKSAQLLDFTDCN